MRRTLCAAGACLLLMASVLPSQAYHVPHGTLAQHGIDPQEWAGPVAWPVTDPLTNDAQPCATLQNAPSVHGLVDQAIDILCIDSPAWEEGDALLQVPVCEQTGMFPASGVGALCFMSPGFKNDPTCMFQGGSQGRSNGLQNPYDGGPCVPAGSPPLWPLTAPAWYRITMDDNVNGAPVPFIGDIGGLGCGVPSEGFVYDDQFAQVVESGHVHGVPMKAPIPGAYGSYTVTKLTAIPPLHVQCGTLPIYIET